ncbi:MAG: ADP-ribosyltransferase, partial [Bifidobacterium castoris]|nr:ADP-ribosyltransferase [Bifidobacterium castoris]
MILALAGNTLADISAFPGEKEILLPRDSEFEVISIGRTDA